MEIRPATYGFCRDFVMKWHRHNKSPQGCKFCICLRDGTVTHGVAICGRPIARHQDDGLTLEITRVCTDGTRNACSMLYGACVRIAKAMGYDRCITYTLKTETGASLKASGFIEDGDTGGRAWNRRAKMPNLFADVADVSEEEKIRWIKRL